MRRFFEIGESVTSRGIHWVVVNRMGGPTDYAYRLARPDGPFHIQYPPLQEGPALPVWEVGDSITFRGRPGVVTAAVGDRYTVELQTIDTSDGLAKRVPVTYRYTLPAWRLWLGR